MSLDDAVIRFAGSGRILCGFDFDGTLSEIVTDAATATAILGATESLERLAGLDGVTVAVLSGRTHAELVERFDHPGLMLIGEHGYDRGEDEDSDGLTPLNGLIDTLQTLVARAPGSRLEIKSRSVVLHTRNVLGDIKEALAARAKAMVDDESDIAVMEGKEVVEFSVTGTDKGAALLDLAGEFGAERILYIGDDVTDEHAFAVLGENDLTIRVGPGETTAMYRVADPSAVPPIIERLIELRS